MTHDRHSAIDHHLRDRLLIWIGCSLTIGATIVYLWRNF
jgi:hypothetical protein